VSGLRISQLGVRFSERTVLSSLSFTIEPGELVGVIGPNGAGKSSLLRAVAGLIARTGTVTFASNSLAELSPAQRARLIAYLPQERDVAWPLDVASVVELGRLPYRTTFQGPSADDDVVVVEAMRAADVTHLAARRVTELSGGERSRVLLARAWAQQTPIFLADEPASGLDLAHQLDLMTMLRAKCDAGGIVLASFHELELAARCTRLLLLDAGKLVADGPPADVLSPDNLLRVYGVTATVAANDDGLQIRILRRSSQDGMR
jgi:iron complex transport system ATP-binding protein